MVTKRNKIEYDARTELSKHGWDLNKRDSVAFNSGSETIKHVMGKTAAAYAGKQAGYRVDSEVVHPERGEIDVLLYGHESRTSPIAVEIETSPTDEVVKDKLNRYYDGTPIQEIYIINTNNLPTDCIELVEYVKKELGL